MTRYQEGIQTKIDFYLAYLLTQSPWRLCVIVDTSRTADRRHISSYPQMALIRKSSKLNRFAVVGPLRGLIVLLSATENIDRLVTSRCNYTGIENVLSYVAVRRTYVESLEKQSLKEPSSTVSSFIVVENIYVTTVTLFCF